MTDNTDTAQADEQVTTYDLFIGALTIFSLVVMVWMILPWISDATRSILLHINNLICVVFMFDFVRGMLRSPRKTHHFFREGGWLDLLGSIPAAPGVEATALFRLAKLGRLGRVARIARVAGTKGIIQEMREKRAEGALAVTLFVAILAMAVISVMVLQAESGAEGANIESGGDAFWWAYVTTTTVGYGDQFPTTGLGRILGMVLMTIGVSIFGVVASYLSSVFLSPKKADANGGQEPAPGSSEALVLQMTRLEEQLRRLEAQLSARA
jgi:voltage-gated potassium channel Kch